MIPQKKCKICRKVGQKIMLNERCASNKCALDRRRSKPGMRPKRPKMLSQYARELIEKQKMKYFYLLKEKQLKRFVADARKANEPAPNALVKALERKLDNVVWLAGYVPSKTTARQLVSHGHFFVNGRRIKNGNYIVHIGDTIEVRPQSQSAKPFKDFEERIKKQTPPSWLKIDPKTFSTTMVRLPQTEEVQLPFNLSLIIDFYSRH